jgi:hypothetical protein
VGKCIFCGEPTGLLRHEHEACRERHDSVEAKIIDFFVEALTSAIEPPRFRRLTEELAQSAFIRGEEFRELVLMGFRALIDTALIGPRTPGEIAQSAERVKAFGRAMAKENPTHEDRIAELLKEFGLQVTEDQITEDQEGRINELMKAFGVKVSDLNGTGHRLAKASILRQLAEGKLPSSLPTIADNPINLERGEAIIWVLRDAAYFTTRTRTQYVGGSHGISFRLTRGVYYRIGAFKGEPIQTQYLSHEGNGDFVITNLNVYFLSPSKVLKLPIRKIVAIQPHSNGLTISRDGSSNTQPAIFTLDDPWFAANAISRINQLENSTELASKFSFMAALGQ